MRPVPRKRFGQHFLSDQSVIAQIIHVLAPQKNDHLVEIGPGQGALTLPILKQVNHLDVVELDRDLVPELTRRSHHHPGLTIHLADALTFDLSQLKKDEKKLRIFGNLPYNISTPLLFHLLDFAGLIADMLFMVQKEVADRMAAKPNDAHYGRLSVMIQYHCEVQKLFNVSNQAFYPPPQVASSMIRLIPYVHLPFIAQNEAHFAELVKQAFSQRRKTLRNSLKNMVSDVVWEKVNLHSDLRAENLSVEDFVLLSNACNGAS